MNKQILLIDDDPIFHVIFTRMIKKVHEGMSVVSFSNGKTALEYINKNYNINNQYIILLDINMPVFNGWQFIENIKNKKMIYNSNIALFVVTSSTDTDDIKRAKSYDFVKDTLSKPLSINSLNDIIIPIIKG